MQQLRGPYTIDELAAISGVSVRTIRRYQQEGVIPRRRQWASAVGSRSCMFYKVDVDRIRQKRGQKKTT